MLLQFKAPLSPLLGGTKGLTSPSHACTACQIGHEVSSVQPAAHPPCLEQQGRICPLHHGCCRRPTQVGLKRGQLRKHPAQTQAEKPPWGTTKLGG